MNIKLMEDSIFQEEIDAINSCLSSGQYTQGKIVEEFEQKFAQWNGSKYAVMVNSGSSANLLIVDFLKRRFNLQTGDEVLVPSVTWSTTVFPVLQCGLKPVFCDVNDRFALDISSMKKMLTPRTKAIFVVHLLGQSADMVEIQHFCKENNLLLIEDCCESTGAKFDNTKVGNFGEMGSFSFYFGHHMTTIEGGMIVTNNPEYADYLKSMRSHGWVKGSPRAQKYNKLSNFVFDIPGYNLRSTNLNAAVGLVQLKKIDSWIETRVAMHQYLLEKIKDLPVKTQHVVFGETSSFCFPLLFESKKTRDYILKNLPLKGVEVRPIVAGNLLRQPVFENSSVVCDETPYADKINDLGVYLPNNQFMTKEKIDYMISSIGALIRDSLSFD